MLIRLSAWLLRIPPSGVRSATAAGMRVIVVPGELEVPAELGTARLKHEELTLEAVRALA